MTNLKRISIITTICIITATVYGGFFFGIQNSLFAEEETATESEQNTLSDTITSAIETEEISLEITDPEEPEAGETILAETQDNGEEASITEPANSYIDGSYVSTITYSVPRGFTDTITLNVTLQGDQITSFSQDNVATNPTSTSYVNEYLAAFNNNSVLNQSIDDVSLARIGGASLTTQAFMNALAAIKSQAS